MYVQNIKEIQNRIMMEIWSIIQTSLENTNHYQPT